MDFVQAIQDVHEGNILLSPPYAGELPQDFPEELCRILAVSNGIEEMMRHPPDRFILSQTLWRSNPR